MEKQLSFLFGAFGFIVLIFIMLSIIDGQGEFVPPENGNGNGEQELSEEEFFEALDRSGEYIFSEVDRSGGFYIGVDENLKPERSSLSVNFFDELYNYEKEEEKEEFIEYKGSRYEEGERFDFSLEIDYEENVLEEDYETKEGEDFESWETIGEIKTRDPQEPFVMFFNFLEQDVDFEDIEFSYFEFEGEKYIRDVFLPSENYEFEFSIDENRYFLNFEDYTYEVRFYFLDEEEFFKFYYLIGFWF